MEQAAPAPALPPRLRRGASEADEHRRLRDAVLAASGRPAAPLVGAFAQVSSTNDAAKALGLAAGGAACAGSVVIADRQTEGRGRFGRTWISPPGGLYLSVLVEPPGASRGRPADWFGRLPLAAGVALAQAVRSAAGVAAELRWPNDVDWAGRKVAGVLCEAGFHPGRPHLAVVGFGVNLRPVALAGAAGGSRPPGGLPAGVERVELAGALVASLRGALDLLAESRENGKDGAALGRLWESLSPTARGCGCTVRRPGGTQAAGRTQGLDPGGGLRVRLDGGATEVVTASETLRILYAGPPAPGASPP